MLVTTRALVLRSVKYGETSLIVTLFTAELGVRSYIVKGVRSSTNRRNQAAMLQPTSLLEIVAYHHPEKALQNLKEFSPAVVYATVQSDIAKSSIAFFCIELLLRLLPANAQAPELFVFAANLLQELDITPAGQCANLPVYFALMCGRFLGYDIAGRYTTNTPYLDVKEGCFTDNAPSVSPFLGDREAAALSAMLEAETLQQAGLVPMNGQTRTHILEWYIAFLQRHTQHMGTIHSLAVLQAVFHQES